jgi:hypothetical protein
LRLIVETRRRAEPQAMHASSPSVLSPDDKLDLLRNLDEFHFWHSLDDRRFCKRCGRSITGRQIVAVEMKGTRGRMRLQCPTVGCVSTASEWIYADPVLAARLKTDFRPNLPVFKSPKTQPRHAQPRHNHRQRALRPWISFREAAARLPILRSIATALHAFHPVA